MPRFFLLQTLPDQMPRIAISKINISRERFRDVKKSDREVEELAQSILRYGQLQPIILGDDNELIDGMNRLTAHELNGAVDIEYMYIKDITETMAREIELESNIRRKEMTWQERAKAIAEIDRLKQLENPNWTQSKTAASIGSNRQADVADAIKINKMVELFPEIGNAKSMAQAMNMATQKAKLITRRIEVESTPTLQFDSIADRIHLGDSVEFIKTLPDNSVDCIITDPPFGVDYDARTSGTVGTASAYEDSAESYWKILGMAPDMYRILKPNSFAIFFFGMTWYPEVRHAFRTAGFTVDDLPIIWDRTGGRTFTNRPDRYFTRGYDVALHMFKGDPVLAQQGKSNILSIPPVTTAERETLVERPIELYAELIRRTTLPGQVVADFFVGSGSCPAAAALLGRRYIGSELSPDRRSYAIRKIAAHTPDGK